MINKIQLRSFLLLIISWAIYFYFCNNFVFILIYLCFVTYAGAIIVEIPKKQCHRKYPFFFAAIVILLPLFFYKYYLPIVDVGYLVKPAASYYFGISSTSLASLLIPIGLSYQTYQSLGYVIDVYRQRVKPTYNIIDSSLFISFFPQLAIGPISKFSEIVPQFKKEKLLSYQSTLDGIVLILYGISKKIIISEQLNPIFRNLFDHKYNISSSVVVFALSPVFVYFDFSSFTDIARGLSKLFGINLVKNFQSPLIQKNVSDFWARWHITLYRWLRDNIFYPLLSLSTKIYYVYLWIAIVFILSALWHGLEPKFILAGSVAAFFVIIESILKRNIFKKSTKDSGAIMGPLLHIYTYCAVSIITFFYVAPDIRSAASLITGLVSENQGASFNANLSFDLKFFVFMGVALLFIALETKENELKKILSAKTPYLKWAIIMALTVLTLIFYQPDIKPFIYFFS